MKKKSTFKLLLVSENDINEKSGQKESLSREEKIETQGGNVFSYTCAYVVAFE